LWLVRALNHAVGGFEPIRKIGCVSNEKKSFGFFHCQTRQIGSHA
jgi:hypothetical protein